MRKFSITVNGQAYEVEVEEIGGAPSFAAAPVAIGDQTSGDIEIDVHAAHSSALLIREAIRTRFPNTPQFLIDFFSLF